MNKLALPCFLLLFAAAGIEAQTCSPKLIPALLDSCDVTDNDTCFWHHTDWWDTVHERHDLAETALDLRVEAPNVCNGAAISLSFEYELYLDLDNNGTLETVVSSRQLPPPNTVFWNNAANPGFAGGIPRAFDQRNGAIANQYTFALETDSLIGKTTAALRWNTTAKPRAFELPLLPIGKHRIKWRLYTAGDLLDSLQYDFWIKDCKKPFVACKALSVNLMQTKMVALWASDFLEYAFDNATLSAQLAIGITRKTGQGKFPIDSATQQPARTVSFACADLGPTPVELWARDKAGNEGFCLVTLLVQDALKVCSSSGGNLLVCTESENGHGVEEFQVGFSTNQPFFPPVIFYPMGMGNCVSFSQATPMSASAIFTPAKDENPLNGVTTLDLALITKHILGLQLLPTPYKLIAADVNKSRTITTFDVVELRKLILGIYDELPNNTSWRFVRKNFVFPNPGNPFQSVFPETVTVGEVVANPLSGRFIGIKVGDVNGMVFGNNLVGQPGTERSTCSLVLPDIDLQAGETLDLPLRISESGQYLGLQFSLQYDPELLDIERVTSEALPGFDRESWAKPRHGLFNLSWFHARACILLPDAPLLTLRFRARAPVRLSEVVAFDDQRLRAEVYVDAENVRPLSLQFRQQIQGQSETANIFAPTPNPTAAGVSLGLRLAQPEQVSFSLSDFSGKILFVKQLYLSEGAHAIEIPAMAMSAAGVYIWRVEAGQQQQNGKLVKR